MRALADRWQTALANLVSSMPAAFAGTDLDPSQVVRRMEKLISRVESLADEVEPRHNTQMSPAEQLAAKLRSALASNAMGGRASADSKARAAVDAVKEAQAAWRRLGPVQGPEVANLERRFREACRRITDHHRHDGPPPHVRHDRRTHAAV
jgi:hypothetical protein